MEQKNDALLPCHVCGDSPHYIDSTNAHDADDIIKGYHHNVFCAAGKHKLEVWGGTKEEVYAAWNTRPTPAPLSKVDGDEKRRALKAYAEGYELHYEEGFIYTENPKYQPDNGENPRLVLGCVTPSPVAVDAKAGDIFTEEEIAALCTKVWKEVKPSSEAQNIRSNTSMLFDSGKDKYTHESEAMPPYVWDVVDVAIQRTIDKLTAPKPDSKPVSGEIDLKALQDAGRFYQSVPQDILHDCLKALEPFESPDRPNSMVDMVQYVCSELARYKAAQQPADDGGDLLGNYTGGYSGPSGPTSAPPPAAQISGMVGIENVLERIKYYEGEAKTRERYGDHDAATHYWYKADAMEEALAILSAVKDKA